MLGSFKSHIRHCDRLTPMIPVIPVNNARRYTMVYWYTAFSDKPILENSCLELYPTKPTQYLKNI